jgi:hypothetical protein
MQKQYRGVLSVGAEMMPRWGAAVLRPYRN